jgi:hypothetical protein
MKHRLLAGIGLAVAIAAVGASPPSRAGESDYIGLFGGLWVGSGVVVKDAVSWQVQCRAEGRTGTNRVTIGGNCNLSVISVTIGADITFDPASGRYAGTYIGAKVGQAQVSGRRDGDVVNLVITWPKPVHGDTLARMTISNAGSGTVRIVIFDNVIPGGPEQGTSDLSLTQN